MEILVQGIQDGYVLNTVQTEPHDQFKQTVYQKIQVSVLLCTSNPKFETKIKTVGASFFVPLRVFLVQKSVTDSTPLAPYAAEEKIIHLPKHFYLHVGVLIYGKPPPFNRNDSDS